MTRNAASVRFLAGCLVLFGALVLALTLSSVLKDQRCRDTGGRFHVETHDCVR